MTYNSVRNTHLHSSSSSLPRSVSWKFVCYATISPSPSLLPSLRPPLPSICRKKSPFLVKWLTKPTRVVPPTGQALPWGLKDWKLPCARTKYCRRSQGHHKRVRGFSITVCRGMEGVSLRLRRMLACSCCLLQSDRIDLAWATHNAQAYYLDARTCSHPHPQICQPKMGV